MMRRSQTDRPGTIGALRASGYAPLSVKEEMRLNIITKMRAREKLFPGIIGYDETVIPAIANAVLARHDILLLGLRGQAKSRIVRMLASLLDERIPIIKGSEINDNPFDPVSRYAVDMVNRHGDDVEIEWIPRDRRYAEKLATPDVTIADLIGDIDPIKAATLRLPYAHEASIHYGLIPRTNRGIFAINELPDLQPRIQVGLLNIMQEKDIQIRGFNIRIPLDIMMVFTANPEDYTNRGSIITPLKDRIGSQVLTHYPRNLSDARAITEQEAWIERPDGMKPRVPEFFKEIVEQIAFQARKSELIDQKSGVSARLPISVTELLVSNIERRMLLRSGSASRPRMTDLFHVLPGLTGKMELVFEGEQEGAIKVGKALIGKAVREVYRHYFPDPLKKKRSRAPQEGFRDPGDEGDPVYGTVIEWFQEGNRVELTDAMTDAEYEAVLKRVRGLEAIVSRHAKGGIPEARENALLMEFILEGLHQNSRIAREELENGRSYRDLVGTLLSMGADPGGD